MNEDVTTQDTGLRRRWVAFGVALGVAILMTLLAPDGWPEGDSSVVLEYEGQTIIETDVTLGITQEVVAEASAEGLAFTLTFPSGLPVEGEIVASVSASRDGEEQRLLSQDVEIRVMSPEIGTELIPVTGWDDEQLALRAVRRPPQDAALVLGLLGLVVVLWVTEALPLFVTSLLIPVVLVFSGVAGAVEATAPFFNPIIVLFFAGFLMAEAMKRTGLDHLLAVSITARARRSPGMLFGAMIGITAVMSMFMSNTAAAAVLVPIAVAVSEPLDELGFRKALVLGIAYAATIGGVGSAIGTPANQLAVEFLGEFAARDITFAEWFVFGLPMVILFLPVMGWYLWRTSHVEVDRERFREVARLALHERHQLGPPDRDQLVVLAVFAAVAVGWLTQTWHGLHAGIVALAGAAALYVLRKLDPEDLGRISWSSLLTFGGGLVLGLHRPHRDLGLCGDTPRRSVRDTRDPHTPDRRVDNAGADHGGLQHGFGRGAHTSGDSVGGCARHGRHTPGFGRSDCVLDRLRPGYRNATDDDCLFDAALHRGADLPKRPGS